MAKKEKVVKINGEDYVEKSLSEASKYFILQVQDLQRQQQNLQFQMDQKLAALDMMNAKLTESLVPEEIKEEIVEKVS
tara:strand:- start:302 stop:535 length:234 start_codon:yes stop_codon:yes gene_type:complete